MAASLCPSDMDPYVNSELSVKFGTAHFYVYTIFPWAFSKRV